VFCVTDDVSVDSHVLCFVVTGTGLCDGLPRARGRVMALLIVCLLVGYLLSFVVLCGNVL
jgi:hypothetical protein